jgi:hypothetical protein
MQLNSVIKYIKKHKQNCLYFMSSSRLSCQHQFLCQNSCFLCSKFTVSLNKWNDNRIYFCLSLKCQEGLLALHTVEDLTPEMPRKVHRFRFLSDYILFLYFSILLIPHVHLSVPLVSEWIS